MRAPRVAWIIAFDRQIPDGYVVRHHCDNPPCVNPSHLAIGTISDNSRDAMLRGRIDYQRGERHPRTRLTDEDIRAIRSSGDMHKVIAAHYGLNRSTVSKIKRRVLWGHVS